MNELRMLADWLPSVVKIASDAGALIMPFFKSAPEMMCARQKDDRSLVTRADLAAHELIMTRLIDLTPSLPVLSEEGANVSLERRQSWQTYWLIDPLDGTRGFVAGSPDFTVNIALIHKGAPVLGVVYSPVTAISYYAFRGGGAFKKDHQSDPSRLRVRTLDWSAYCVLLGHYSTTPAARRTCEKQPGCTLRQLNSSIKFMHIADGLADFYPRWGKTSEWDTAASQCVLEEAGGLVLDLAGNSLHYNGRASLINPPFVAVGDQSDVDAILAWVLRCQ